MRSPFLNKDTVTHGEMTTWLGNEVLNEVTHRPLHARRLLNLHVQQPFHAVEHHVVSLMPCIECGGGCRHGLLLAL